MKYAITLLRMEEHGLQVKLNEISLKTEEFPSLQPEYANHRKQYSHMMGLTEKRLQEVREALKVLEK